MKWLPAAEAAEEDDGGRMVEAAQALAGMFRRSAAHRPQHQHVDMEAVVISQEQPVAAEVDCEYAPRMNTSPQKAEKIVGHNPTQLSHQSNPAMKMRRKLTEAEKEERKRRHVMANRESARETIRRRQAMHMELTRKAADVLEENESLKKQKKLMVEDFKSLKGRNEFLKAQLAEVMKVGAGDVEEEPNSSEEEKSCPTTVSTPLFVANQPPSLVPCFWPPLVQSSDAFPFQCVSHPRHSQYPIPPGDTSCLHQGHEHSRGTPVYIVPVPWLLPFLTCSGASGPNSQYCGKCSCSDTARLSEDNHNQNMRAEMYNPMQTVNPDGVTLPHDNGVQSSVGQTPVAIVVPGLFSPVRRQENLEPPMTCQVGDAIDLRNGSAQHGSFRMSRAKPKDVMVAGEARRRRKELMRLKNVNCK